MQVTEFVYDDIAVGRLVEGADGYVIYIDMEDGVELDVDAITRFGEEMMIVTVNGDVYMHQL